MSSFLSCLSCRSSRMLDQVSEPTPLTTPEIKTPSSEPISPEEEKRLAEFFKGFPLAQKMISTEDGWKRSIGKKFYEYSKHGIFWPSELEKSNGRAYQRFKMSRSELTPISENE